ncbi:metallophosphoesterase [Oceanobacillus bengalensis]|uniref:Metallophosphoesterase n=1 Tax=Oceanobacillus bengalensis TaxID=1435466 RepID=A0A494Z530_9BACI|nr:metallophosphoesterase [Oceanobacillus bengalensis]RKQ17611.1 metallophosphoesterase [Oceanobacillus bengalensis]
MKKKKGIIILCVAIFIVIFSYTQNNLLSTTKITVRSGMLPSTFDGYKIVQLSDLHSKQFGKNQTRLVKRVETERPNIIVFTGDLVDQKKADEESNITLMKKLANIAPTYFVTGNHEFWSGNAAEIEKAVQQVGVNVLRNGYERIEKGGEEIYIAGMDDPAIMEDSSGESIAVEDNLQKVLDGVSEDAYTILLSHRPEMFSIYQQQNIDLIFSGHAHGGQLRLPFLGGLVAPDQGLFPEYTAGKYIENDSVLIVNRGLGNSIIPQRIFNRPEIVSVTLERE